MKTKQMIFLCIICMWINTTQLHAKQSSMLYITSDELPYIYLVQPQNDQSLDLYILPSDLYIGKEKLKDQSVPSAQQQISHYFHLSSQQVLQVNIKQIEKDFQVRHGQDDLTTMDGITSYFMKVKDELQISDLFHYQRYIESDLTLSDYFDYYQLFSHEVTIRYHYLPYIELNDCSIPLSSSIK